MTEKIPLAYRILRWFLRVITRVFFRQVEVVGLENIPDRGRFCSPAITRTR